MAKLTDVVARREISYLKVKQDRTGLSSEESLYLQALEIALQVLEQQEKGAGLISTPQHALDAKFKEHFGLVQQGGWISCSDRMPDDSSTMVLATEEDGSCWIAFYKIGRDKWDDGDFHDDIEGITHWQPLPAPPQSQTSNTQIDNEGWVDWHGGGIPVDGDVMVDTKWDDGEENTSLAKYQEWYISENLPNIIAYRLVKD